MWEKESIFARKAARSAGKVLLELFGNTSGARKKGEIDLVTDGDLRSEQLVVDMIRSRFPNDGILAEESGESHQDAERVWIIDPLDGTTNFAHSFPFFAVSIALEVQGEIVLGSVFNPVFKEHYEGVKGKGASLNGKPISVSAVAALQDSLLATGFPYTVHQNPDRVLRNFRSMLTRAQGIRRPGAASLDLCYVASGVFDGFWEEGLKPWDSAAGAIILEEAGGRVSTYGAHPFSPYAETIVASNGLIHDAMLTALRD
jgi:myo-inositol-1(or 4)-monophosphatase